MGYTMATASTHQKQKTLTYTTIRKKAINISMMVNECSTERMTWSSAMRRQAILEYSSVHQPLNYLLCLKFRAMIKFQRFVWQHCYPIPSSNEAFILKIERETGIKWQETMPAQAKILKMNIFNKDNIRFVCWMLRVGCHFNTCVLYLHKTAHAFYTRWQPYIQYEEIIK